MFNSRVLLSREWSGWLKGIAAALLAAMVLVAGGSRQAEGPDSLNVGGLRVLQGEGKVRMSLDSSPDIGTTLSLRNEKGIPQIIITVRPNGEKALVISDVGKNGIIAMNLHRDGAAMISLSFIGQSGVFLSAVPDGESSLQFRDKNEKVRVKLGLRPDGTPGLEFFDEEGKSTFRTPMPEGAKK